MDSIWNHHKAVGKQRRGSFWFGAGMMVCGLLAVIGAWSGIAHHDGLLPVIAPVSAMPSLAALLARRAAREKSARLP